MPYCPKCDMEFVEGITVCSDCGAPLFDSVEAARAAMKEAEERALEQFVQDLGPEEIQEMARAAKEAKENAPAPSVYVKKSAHYEDMKSSASAFLLVGCASIALAGILLGGIIPAAGNSRWVFGGLFCAAGLFCLAICFKTRKDMASVKEAAAQEDARTKELVEQFVTAHSADAIDRQLAEEAALTGSTADTPEELSLKRYGLIQDLLVTENDLPDPSYVDALSEEIYDRLFER